MPCFVSQFELQLSSCDHGDCKNITRYPIFMHILLKIRLFVHNSFVRFLRLWYKVVHCYSFAFLRITDKNNDMTIQKKSVSPSQKMKICSLSPNSLFTLLLRFWSVWMNIAFFEIESTQILQIILLNRTNMTFEKFIRMHFWF